MNKIRYIFIILLFSFLAQAQVRIYPDPKPGYEQRIRDHLKKLRIVDTHEHLMNPNIISPAYSERYLHEWLETVPANKIMAFGGDYHIIENVYRHLLFAKEIVGNVLVEKVKCGYFSEEEAIRFAEMILHDNAVELFGLK